MSQAHKYFSRLDLNSLKGKSKEISEGTSEKVQQLKTEKKALQDELAVANEKVQALTIEVTNRELELTAARSKVEDSSHTISHLKGLVKDLDGQVSSAEERRKMHCRFQFKQGRIEGLRTCSGLGFERGFRTGHSDFPQSNDMRALVEGYRRKICHQIWHFMLFIQKASPLAQSYLEGAVAFCQGVVDKNEIVPEAGILFDLEMISGTRVDPPPG